MASVVSATPPARRRLIRVVRRHPNTTTHIMKHPLLWLLTVATIAVIIAGFIYLSSATSSSALIVKDARTPSLVSGITCLCIGTGLLVLGVFSFRRKD